MTFKEVIQAKKVELQTQLDVIDTDLQKKVEEETNKAKLAGKNLKIQLRRLDAMLETYMEYEADFEIYTMVKKS